MTLRDFLSALSRGNGPDHLYLQQLPLTGPFATLEQDLRLPKYIESTSQVRINLWYGPSGNVTPLHFDMSHNFLAQVRGQKRVVLFSPDQTEFLYPYPAQSKIPHMSMVDIEQPDFSTFPEFRRAVRFETMLNEGQMLFIPIYWWHQVHTLATSISVNFWWKPDFLRRGGEEVPRTRA